jgi:DNA-binding response OmpR family regulator
MPEKDGIETILELRAHSPGVRIIAMSGGGDKGRLDVLGHAKLLGAVLTIEKPFTSAEMMAMVDRTLRGAQREETDVS